jgi:hypothetical protein
MGVASTIASTAEEAGQKTAQFLVTRSERLPFAQRVFFSIAGTATAPGSINPKQIDYTLGGMVVPKALTTGAPHVDIPANETLATVTLTPNNDARLENHETAVFTVAANAGYDIGAPSSVSLNLLDDDSAHVAFRATSGPPVSGYLNDTGAIYSAAAGAVAYGWDADNSANARTRHNSQSPDARHDSFNHLQKNGANRKWEIALANGMYQVQLVAGDPNNTDGFYKLSLENTLALSGRAHDQVHWFKRTVNVQVSDGKLTLGNAHGSSNNKICFIDISAAPLGAAAGDVTGDIAISLLPPPPPSAHAHASHPRSATLFSDDRIGELPLI